MARRSTPQKKIDDAAFPIRVKFRVPGSGLLSVLGSRNIDDWLKENLQQHSYAHHGTDTLGGYATAIYFRSPIDAVDFIDAFPELELADGTTSSTYTAPGLCPGRA